MIYRDHQEGHWAGVYHQTPEQRTHVTRNFKNDPTKTPTSSAISYIDDHRTTPPCKQGGTVSRSVGTKLVRCPQLRGVAVAFGEPALESPAGALDEA